MIEILQTKKIICVIPARGGSKAIKNKNIYPILGKPLITWTLEQANESKYIDDIYVSTDCDLIADVSEKSGVEVFNETKDISGDKSSSELAILHLLDTYQNKSYPKKIDIAVFLQCTSPLRLNHDIDNSIEKFYTGSYDSLMSVTQIDDLTIWSKTDNILKSINFDYKNRGMRQNRPENFIENGSIYLFTPSIIRNNTNRLGGKIGLYQMKFWQTWELDSNKEIDLIEYYLNKFIINNKSHQISVQNVKLVALDFDGVLTDNKVLIDQEGKESAFANRADGLIISKLKQANLKIVVISTEKNPIVKHRCNKLGVQCHYGIDNKSLELKKICNEYKIDLKNVVFVGNDLNDKEVMKIVGYPICPSDAHEEIKNISSIILKTAGGDGILRELYNYFGD